jgi:hypothetical protein
MAERVQVQGIGGAVPGISPTIQRGGQYSVQVQQAGRNKLMDLADALGQVNPLLRQYAGVAEQEAEMFEEELARKSPEEVQAMLKKTESELDKQVRRGGLGWLMSPLNQKRKLRAVGQASSRLMMEQVYNRLDNPQEGDADLSTSDIISLVQQDFVGNNEALAGSTFAQEGLQEAVNPQILPLVRQYDAQKNRIAKGENGVATVSGFYDLIDGLKEVEGLTTGAIASGAFTDEFNKIWENTNAHTAVEQRDLFKQTLFNLANNGHEDEAAELRIWAEDNNLKFGNASMSELERDNYDKYIEDVAEQAANSRDKKRRDTIEVVNAEAMQAYRDIKNPKKRYGSFQGREYTTERQLDEAIGAFTSGVVEDEDVILDPVGREQLRTTFASNKARVPDPIKEASDKALVQVKRDTVDSLFDPKEPTFIGSEVSSILASTFPNIADTVDQNPQIIQETYSLLMPELTEESYRLASESDDYDASAITIKLRPIARAILKDKKQDIIDSFREIASIDEEKNKLLAKVTSEAGDEEIIDETILQSLNLSEKTRELEKVKNLTAVLLNTEIKNPQQRNRAFNILKDYDFSSLLDIAYKRKPIETKKLAAYPSPFKVYRSTSKNIFATKDQADSIKLLYKKAAASLGLYTNPDTLTTRVLPEGEAFNPEALDPKFIPILTEEEIQKGSSDDSVKRKAELIGKGDAVLEFYNSQKDLLDRYKKKKYPYPSYK